MKHLFWGKKQIKFLFLFWVCTVTFLSLYSVSEMVLFLTKIPFFTELLQWVRGSSSQGNVNTDKIVHFIFYFGFTILFYFSLENKNKLKSLIYSFLFSIFWGILMEILQKYFTEGRTADVKDIFFNIFGTVVAIFLIQIKFIQKINYKSI